MTGNCEKLKTLGVLSPGTIRPAHTKYRAPEVTPDVGVSQVKVPLPSVGCVPLLVSGVPPVEQLVVAGVIGDASPAPGDDSGWIGTAYNATFQSAALSPLGFVAGIVDVHETANAPVVFSCDARRTDDT